MKKIALIVLCLFALAGCSNAPQPVETQNIQTIDFYLVSESDYNTMSSAEQEQAQERIAATIILLFDTNAALRDNVDSSTESVGRDISGGIYDIMTAYTSHYDFIWPNAEGFPMPDRLT